MKNSDKTREQLLKERTKELEDKNKELDKALKVFVGRELKISDLEKRIREMEPKRYEFTLH